MENDEDNIIDNYGLSVSRKDKLFLIELRDDINRWRLNAKEGDWMPQKLSKLLSAGAMKCAKDIRSEFDRKIAALKLKA